MTNQNSIRKKNQGINGGIRGNNTKETVSLNKKKQESDLKIAQTMRVTKTREIKSTVTNLQTSTLKNQNHKNISSI